jgi:nitroreductase
MEPAMSDLASRRTSDQAVNPLFLARWSPRTFDGSAIAPDQLATILEAARWAPSAYNYQPWRLLYAVRGTPAFDRFLSALVPFNQGWAKDAGALVYIVSDTLIGPDADHLAPSHSHSFDAGAAWAQLALQSTLLGLHAHGMTGIDFDAARTLLGVPERYRIEAAVAIGRRAESEAAAAEVPSDRKPLTQIAFDGGFPA